MLGLPEFTVTPRAIGAVTLEGIRTLVEALDDPRLKVQAACALLDRAWGKPIQPLRGEDGAPSLTAMHLLAAQLVSHELLEQPTRSLEPAALAAEPQQQILDLLASPPPPE